MRAKSVATLALALLGLAAGSAQDGASVPDEASARFGAAAADVRAKLEASLEELAAVRAQLAEEKIPLSRELSALEAELRELNLEYRETTRKLNVSALDLTKLKNEIATREEQSTYLTNLFLDYQRNFESRLHVAEEQRYEELLEAARLAPENANLSDAEVYDAQIAVLTASIARLDDLLGGTRFDGTALDPTGLLREGTFALVGPVALFRSADGAVVGTVERQVNSVQPTIVPFARPEDAEAAANVVETGAGAFPLDTTLGNAHRVAETEDSLLDEFEKGGSVMWPILALASAALLVALWKWISLAFVRRPSNKQIGALLGAAGRNDQAAAEAVVARLEGPAGRMLSAGVAHMNEPRDLIEEVMYETVLTTRLRLQRMLPFIAICAAAAPLLGLLGTVTGIINTFKLITIFGSGDVKMLSGGISEALLTTKFGLVVAIPSLLLHAFLSRKARAVVGQMEAVGVAFVNRVEKASRVREVRPTARAHGAVTSAAPDPELVRAQVNEILRDVLGPVLRENEVEAVR